MMNRVRSLVRREEGQGMTEYIIIVALIAIAAIGTLLTHFFMDVGGRWVQWLFSRA